MVADAKYDAKAKKFTTSAIEQELKLSAPGVYVSHDGASYAPCKTSHSQASVSVEDIKTKLVACAAAPKGKAEL